MLRGILSATFAAAGLIVHPASARSAFLELGAATSPPAGFVEMCRDGGPMCANGDEIGLPPNITGLPMVTGAIVPADRSRSTSDCDKGPFSASYKGTARTLAFSYAVATINVMSSSLVPGVTGLPEPLADAACAGLHNRLKSRNSSAALRPSSEIKAGDRGGSLRHSSRLDSENSSEADGEFQQLNQINRMVNHRVVQETDERIYGLADLWTRSGIGRGAKGDCEDIAIEKRLQLLKAGFAPKRLSFAVVYQAKIGLHTVLLARTDVGDVVLDSRTDRLRAWHETPYRWLSIQDFSTPATWHKPAVL